MKKKLRKKETVARIVVYFLILIAMYFCLFLFLYAAQAYFLQGQTNYRFINFCAAVMSIFYILVVVIEEYLLKKQNTQLISELDATKRYMQEIELQKRQEELRALQSQINPHFLYNSLDVIRGMALEHDELEVSDAVGTLSSMFKYTMDFQKMMVSVTSEILQAERYLTMQNFRFSNRFRLNIVYDCEPEVLNRVMIPKFTLQPLVENAVMHGLKDRPSEGVIELRFIQVEHAFIILVCDNGKGIEEAYMARMNRVFCGRSKDTEIQQEEGIALPNVDGRIKFYYGPEYGLHLRSTVGIGTEVEVRIPFEDEEKEKS